MIGISNYLKVHEVTKVRLTESPDTENFTSLSNPGIKSSGAAFFGWTFISHLWQPSVAASKTVYGHRCFGCLPLCLQKHTF